MNEQQPQTLPLEGRPIPEQEQHFKTLAVRVEENLHAQLRFIAQLSGTSVTEEIRTAITGRIATAQDDPELLAKARQARDEIEREAAARTAAIVGFMGPAAVAGAGTTRARRTSKTVKE